MERRIVSCHSSLNFKIYGHAHQNCTGHERQGMGNFYQLRCTTVIRTLSFIKCHTSLAVLLIGDTIRPIYDLMGCNEQILYNKIAINVEK